MLILVGVVSVLLLTAATGYFVAQEFAYVAVDRNRLRQLAEDGDKAAERAYRVTQRLSFMLSGAQFGITVTALLVGYVSEPFLGDGTAALLGLAGLPAGLSTALSIVVALLFSTVVQMVFGELAPKNLAIAKPEALAKALSRSTLVYLAVAGPLIRMFDSASTRLLRAVGIEPIEELPQGATAEDLRGIIDESRQGGHLDAGTSRLLEGGLDFRTLTAGQVMTPRVDVHLLRADDPAVRVVRLLDTGRSRFPVVGADIDDVIGVVGIAEVLTVAPAARASTPVRDIAVAPLYLPDSLPLPEVLERLRAEHRQLACVVDEFGGFAGVVSFEDVAEEVVGEILDEDDHMEVQAIAHADGSWSVPARWRVDEVAEVTGIELPESAGYDTVSGLVMQRLGRVPRPGDHVEVEVGIADADLDDGPHKAVVAVTEVHRHVPRTVLVSVSSKAGVSA
ncbi:hemolysin family protein [Actinokineospora cianjurensis]|uniref:CBS domain containing-hemolysin-like protein n=1 Tax=Actinokineospora cianjurensis TaxID=585224 RepID=A0A421AW68_9PSEU|nr:hemolysin family protein [Actinokineospora cianjurensis]RLK54268.1 CBS domain containing-hemolysin-like protein [Actinokineospora cianjurensis]